MNKWFKEKQHTSILIILIFLLFLALKVSMEFKALRRSDKRKL